MAISSVISELLDKSAIVDIIEFAESPLFLNIKLFPVQKFLLKLVYNMPLSSDISDDPIILKDQFNERVEQIFYSEYDFHKFLYDTGRINSLEFDETILEIELIIGRRGTKTTLSSIITAYTLYTLLSNESPHEYVRVIKQSEIGVAICSNSVPNAKKQLREVSKMVYNADWFKKFLVSKEPTADGFFLNTKEQLDNPDRKIGNIYVTVFAVSPSVRGSSNIVVILDEYAHYIDADSSTQKQPLDELAYEALTPSVSGFTNINGNPIGKAITITSPNGKKGKVWKDKKESKNRKDKIFMNIPSWWIYPNISSAYLRAMYNESEKSFWQEYGAEFVDKESNWIINFDKFNAMRDMSLRNTIRNGNPTIRYHAGVDLALTGDGAAIVIGHFENMRTRITEKSHLIEVITNEKVYVIDYIWYDIKPKGQAIQIDEIINQMKEINFHFNIFSWNFDQWGYEMFSQVLDKYTDLKLNNMNQISATQQTNSILARKFKQYMNEGRLILPDYDEIFDEIKDLKEKISGRFIKVENVNGHDDRFSAILKVLAGIDRDPNKADHIKKLNTISPKMFNKIHHKVIRTNVRSYAKGIR